jgi:hypothetical protein
MPSSFTNGYKIPRKSRSLFLTYGMDATLPGKYNIYHGNINEIEFSDVWTYFSYMNQLQVGSLLDVRVKMRDDCIGLFAPKIC